MGSWDWDSACASCALDEGQYRILGVAPGEIDLGVAALRRFIHSDDLPRLEAALAAISESQGTIQAEFRIRRPNGELRPLWKLGVHHAAHERVVYGRRIALDL